MSIFHDFYLQFKKSLNEIKGKTVKIVARISAYLVWLVVIIGFSIFVIQISCDKVYNLYSHLYMLSDSEPNATSFSIEDEKYIRHLIERNKIIPISAVYSNTLDYYNSLISILIALLGIFAFVSWFSLRNKTKHDSEESLEKIIGSTQFEAWIEKHIEKAVEKNTAYWLSDKEQIIDDIKELVLNRIEINKEQSKNDKILSVPQKEET